MRKKIYIILLLLYSTGIESQQLTAMLGFLDDLFAEENDMSMTYDNRSFRRNNRNGVSRIWIGRDGDANIEITDVNLRNRFDYAIDHMAQPGVYEDLNDMFDATIVELEAQAVPVEPREPQGQAINIPAAARVPPSNNNVAKPPTAAATPRDAKSESDSRNWLVKFYDNHPVITVVTGAGIVVTTALLIDLSIRKDKSVIYKIYTKLTNKEKPTKTSKHPAKPAAKHA